MGDYSVMGHSQQGQVLIVGIDWHGDVASVLQDGFEEIGFRGRVEYVINQRRRGVWPRLRDELLAHPRFGPVVRRRQMASAEEQIRKAVRQQRPDCVVCLAPETLSRASVECLLETSRVCWWFADDPRAYERRALAESPAVLEYVTEQRSVCFVAHPGWKVGSLADATYLPYASDFLPADEVSRARERRAGQCVAVGSPRKERAELLTDLYSRLGSRLAIWGWGPRGQLGMNSAARPFRAALRGWSVLSRQRTRDVFASASVVLNLQDVQMLGAWNPQTFDLLALGAAQVVWNEAPVDYLDSAPPFGMTADALADLVMAQIDDPDLQRISDGLEEAKARHRWRHRAMTLVEI